MKRGLIEGEAPNYTISLGVAKASKQLPSYTRVRGLERDKLKQMILQYIQNAGSDGAKRDAILEYLQGTLPSRNTYEQNETLIYHLLSELRKAGLIEANGKIWLAKINSKRTVSTTVYFLCILAYSRSSDRNDS